MKLFIEILLFIGFILSFILGLLVYLKGKNVPANKYFFALMISGALWSLFLVIGIIFTNNFIDKICIAFGLFANNFFLLFSRSFSITKKIKPLFVFFTLLISALLSVIISFSNIIIGETIFHPEGFIESPDGPLAFLFYMFHATYSLIAFYYLIKGYRLSSGIRKIQFQYLFIGLSVFFSWIFFMNMFLPSIGIYYFISLTSFAIIYLAIFFLYIISRFRFMGIRFVLRRGAIYTITVIIAFGLYTALVFLAKGLFESANFADRFVSNSIAIVLIALGFEPLRKGVRKVIDHWFFPEGKKIEKSLAKIKKELPKTVDFDKFAQALAGEISQIIPAQGVQFFLLDKKEGIYHLIFPENEKDKVKLRLDDLTVKYILARKEIVVREELPLLAEGKSAVEKEELEKVAGGMEKYGWLVAVSIGFEQANGLLCLSAKSNKEAYTLEDLKFLENLKYQASSALDNAILYKEAVERIKIR